MTSDELTRLAGVVIGLFGRNDRWAPDHLGVLAERFEHVPERDAVVAVRQLFDSGQQSCPSPSVVAAAARKITGQRIQREREERQGEDPNCPHVWGVLPDVDQPDRDDGRRLCVCALCHVEKFSDMPTVGEWADQRDTEPEPYPEAI